MKYFIDTEFIEDGKTIDLISIGIVAEDGRELYLGNRECDFSKASDWVIDNVLLPMGFDRMPKCKWRDGHMKPIDPAFWVSHFEIAVAVFKFTGCKIKGDLIGLPEGVPTPKFWGEWCSYDWVAFCQLFGTMMELPDGFPMRCSDVVQYCEDQLGLDTENWPASLEVEGNHNALQGAKTVRARWEWCKNQEALMWRCP